MDSATSSWNKLCYVNTDKVYVERSSDGVFTFTFMQPSSIEPSSLYTADLVINQVNLKFKYAPEKVHVFRQKGV